MIRDVQVTFPLDTLPTSPSAVSIAYLKDRERETEAPPTDFNSNQEGRGAQTQEWRGIKGKERGAQTQERRGLDARREGLKRKRGGG